MLRNSTARSLALALVLAGGLQAQDDCVNAFLIGNGFTMGSTVGATTGVPYAAVPIDNEIWYRYVAPSTGTVIASLCTPGWASFDSVLAAWEGLAGCTGLGFIAAADDTCGLASSLSFPVQVGKTYYISVGGYAGDTGSFSMWVNCTAGPAVPVNDHCDAALPLYADIPVAGTNVEATWGPEPLPSCGYLLGGDVWYWFYAQETGIHEVTTCYPWTGFDTVVGVWTGACGALVQVVCGDDGCNLPCCPLTTMATFSATANQAYWVSVSGYGGQAGDFMIGIGRPGRMDFDFITRHAGELGYRIRGGPPLGSSLAAITLFQGAFPNGWFLGIDVGLTELAGEIDTFPFRTTLGPSGEFVIGPIAGLPTGLTFYGVGIATPFGSDYQYFLSAPKTVTVP